MSPLPDLSVHGIGCQWMTSQPTAEQLESGATDCDAPPDYEIVSAVNEWVFYACAEHTAVIRALRPSVIAQVRSL